MEDDMIRTVTKEEFDSLRKEVREIARKQDHQEWKHDSLEVSVKSIHEDQVTQQVTLDKIERTLNQIKWMIMGAVGFIVIIRLYAIGDFQGLLQVLTQLIS